MTKKQQTPRKSTTKEVRIRLEVEEYAALNELLYREKVVEPEQQRDYIKELLLQSVKTKAKKLGS